MVCAHGRRRAPWRRHCRLKTDLSLVAPRFGRKYDGGRVLGAALLAIAAGTALRSLPLDGAIWIGTLMLSAGIAFGNVLLPGLVKREFPERAPALIGMYAAAMATIAGIASGLAVPISRLPGANWRWSIGIWAILALVTLIVWIPQSGKGQGAAPAATLTKPAGSVWRDAIGWQVSLFFALAACWPSYSPPSPGGVAISNDSPR